MICTILVLVPVFLLSQVSAKRSERERDKGDKRRQESNDMYLSVIGSIFEILLLEWITSIFIYTVFGTLASIWTLSS